MDRHTKPVGRVTSEAAFTVWLLSGLSLINHCAYATWLILYDKIGNNQLIMVKETFLNYSYRDFISSLVGLTDLGSLAESHVDEDGSHMGSKCENGGLTVSFNS